VKEARPKEKLHIVLFHLFKILENAHYSDRKKISSLLGMGAGASYVGREDGITKGHKETLGVMYMFIILIVIVSGGIHMFRIYQIFHFKIHADYCMSVIPQ